MKRYRDYDEDRYFNNKVYVDKDGTMYYLDEDGELVSIDTDDDDDNENRSE